MIFVTDLVQIRDKKSRCIKGKQRDRGIETRDLGQARLPEDAGDIQANGEVEQRAQKFEAGADRVGLTLDAETGEKIDVFDVDALVAHQARGQHGIETAGDQGNGFAEFGPKQRGRVNKSEAYPIAPRTPPRLVRKTLQIAGLSKNTGGEEKGPSRALYSLYDSLICLFGSC